MQTAPENVSASDWWRNRDQQRWLRSYLITPWLLNYVIYVYGEAFNKLIAPQCRPEAHCCGESRGEQFSARRLRCHVPYRLVAIFVGRIAALVEDHADDTGLLCKVAFTQVDFATRR